MSDTQPSPSASTNVDLEGLFEEERPPSRRTDYLQRDHITREENKLLTFRWDAGQKTWWGEPIAPFLPRGLIIWGAPPGATVDCQIAQYMEIAASHDPAPVEFFAFGKSFEQIVERMVLDGIELPSWVKFTRIGMHERCRIRIHLNNDSLGPAAGIRLCMWGMASVRL